MELALLKISFFSTTKLLMIFFLLMAKMHVTPSLVKHLEVDLLTVVALKPTQERFGFKNTLTRYQ